MTRLEAALAELAEAIRAEVREELRQDAGPPALLSVDAAAERLAISRTSAYGLIRSGKLRTLAVGSRRLVPASAIDELIGERAS
jgi:excisionase family DNA binding protein